MTSVLHLDRVAAALGGGAGPFMTDTKVATAAINLAIG
jgi:hypothetical protein